MKTPRVRALTLTAALLQTAALALTSSAQTAFPTPVEARPGDGYNRLYAVFIAQPVTAWTDVVDAYNLLISKGADPANVFVLMTGDAVPTVSPEIIDGKASRAEVTAAFNYCAQQMDGDDIFIWTLETHGNGYMGNVTGDARNTAYHGYTAGRLRSTTTDEELDFKESDFDFSVLCAAGGLLDGRDFHFGLNEWGIKYYPYSWTMVRYKAMSHFTDVYVEGRGLLSDNDVLIERFTDLPLGDFNRDGVIQTSIGEILDWDGDGNLPYDRATGQFDEDDWGPIDGFEDNVPLFHSLLPNHTHTIFDAGLDGHLDIDVNPGATLEVNGTDFDNNGTIDGIDLNQDGDLDDWVAIDETVSIYRDALADDELGLYLDAMTNGTKIVISSTCYSGGLIDDLSGNNIIVLAGSREECDSPAGFIHQMLTLSFTTYSALADTDGNGRVSILEAFNLASLHPWVSTSEGMDRLQYDDNGDRYGHEDPLPNGGDGELGAATYLDLNREPSFTSTPVTTASAGSEYRYVIAVTDPDIGDSLTVSMEAGPEWLTLITNPDDTVELSGVPPQPGSFDVTLLVRDQLGLSAMQSFTIGVAQTVIASGESTSLGTVTGSLANTAFSDNVYERITEVVSPGSKPRSYSYLDHTWTFNVAAGNSATFNVEAFKSVSSDNDHFAFAYSTDNVNFLPMLTVTKSADDNTLQSFTLPSGIQGAVYIRVTDTDRTGGKRVLDSISIDRMFIRSE